MSRPPTIPSVYWPVVELLLEPGGADELATLVRSLATVCRPSAPDHANQPSGRLLSSPHAPEASLLAREPHVPSAVVVRNADDLAHPVTGRATAIIAFGPPGSAALAGADPSRTVVLSPLALRAADVLPVSPFVRQRLRQREGLPDDLVLTVGRPGAPPLSASSVATGLRLAAVANVSGPSAVTAMALGAPVVTDAATADTLGATDDIHVVVAEGSSAVDVATQLAIDTERCARLSRAGRQLIESHHDTDHVARSVVAAMGLVTPAMQPTAVGIRLADRLSELGTPSGHPIELAFADRFATIGVSAHIGGSWR